MILTAKKVWPGAILWLLAVVLLGNATWETAQNWQGSEIAGHPDEAAHFVTGVMIYDYLLGHVGESPIRFAESYYARYPKVAIGHWPPVYYGVQAAWYAVFKPGIMQAHMLNLLGAMALWCTFWLLLRRHANGAVILAIAAIFAVIPVFVTCTVLVLSDIFVVVGVMLVAALLLRCLAEDRSLNWLALSVVAAATILTKGNAWPLIPAIFFTPAIAGEWTVYKKPRLWLSLTAMVVLAAPFYWYAQRFAAGYPLGGIARSSQWEVLASRILSGFFIFKLVPVPIWLLAAVGLMAGWQFSAGPARRLWAYTVAVMGSLLGFLMVTGLSFENRVFLPALCCAAVLAVFGIEWLAGRWAWARPVCLAAGLAAVLAGRGGNDVVRVEGYAEVARALPNRPGGVAILVISDPIGEGAIVAERLLADPQRQGVVLRASKILAESSWNNPMLRELFNADEDLARYLAEQPIHYIVRDSGNQLAYVKRIDRLTAAGVLREVRSWDFVSHKVTLLSQDAVQGKPIRQIGFSLGRSHGDRQVEFAPKP